MKWNVVRYILSLTLSAGADGCIYSFIPLFLLKSNYSLKEFGFLMTIRTSSVFLVALPSGIFIDKYDTRSIQLVVLTIRTLILSYLAITLFYSINIPYFIVCILLFLLGSFEIISENVFFNTVPKIVEQDILLTFNSYFRSIGVLSTLTFGGLVTGFLFSKFSWACLLFAIIFYTLAYIFFLSISRTYQKNLECPDSFIKQCLSGLCLIFKSKVYSTYLISVSIQNFCFYAISGTLVVYIKDFLKLSDIYFSISNESTGLGLLFGSFLLSFVASKFNKNFLFFWGLLLASLAFFMISIFNTFYILLISLCIIGISWSICGSISNTYAQVEFDQLELGKIRGGSRLFSAGCMPLGTTIGTTISIQYGITTTHKLIMFISLFILLFFVVNLRDLIKRP